MKKLLSTLMALVMALSLAVTAFADNESFTRAEDFTGNGSVTITNATLGETYYLYKVFDATYAVDEEGKTILDENGKAIVAYTIDPDDKFFAPLFGADGTTTNEYFIYDSETGAVVKRANVRDEDIITYLDGVANSAAVQPDDVIKAENPAAGSSVVKQGEQISVIFKEILQPNSVLYIGKSSASSPSW